jgi:hypothetical protein
MLELLLASALTASQFAVDVDNVTFNQRTGKAEAMLRVTNQGSDSAGAVAIRCAFLDASKKALDMGSATFSSLAPGAVAYSKAGVFLDTKPEYVSCSVVAFY